MAQIIDPPPSDESDSLLCCYVNATSKIQIARITNVPDWYFERVVFPGQRLLFEAVGSAMLEIHTGMMASAILSDTILCSGLSVESESEYDDEADDSPDGAASDILRDGVANSTKTSLEDDKVEASKEASESMSSLLV
ncbi:MAG: DUF1830 domain-containing protein [Phormidesmis sp.]